MQPFQVRFQPDHGGEVAWASLEGGLERQPIAWLIIELRQRWVTVSARQGGGASDLTFEIPGWVSRSDIEKLALKPELAGLCEQIPVREFEVISSLLDFIEGQIAGFKALPEIGDLLMVPKRKIAILPGGYSGRVRIDTVFPYSGMLRVEKLEAREEGEHGFAYLFPGDLVKLKEEKPKPAEFPAPAPAASAPANLSLFDLL